MKPHTVMGSFLYEGYRKLGLKCINSADLACQFRRDFRPIVKKRSGKYLCKRYVVKYNYVDSSFYKESLLINIKSI